MRKIKEFTIKPCCHDSPEAKYMIENLREVDILEVLASNGHDPATAIIDSLKSSTEAYVAINREGTPICVFGVFAGPEFKNASVWLLATEELWNYKRELLIMSKKYVEQWLNQYGLLFNFVDVRNEKSVRWLKWLGFNFELAPEYGINKEDFYCFWMRKEEG